MDIKILRPLGAEISGLDLNILSEDELLKLETMASNIIQMLIGIRM